MCNSCGGQRSRSPESGRARRGARQGVRTRQTTRSRGARDRRCECWSRGEEDEEEVHDEEEDHERQVDADGSQPQRRDHLAQGAKWRLREGVDGLGDEQRGPARPPLPGEDPDPVEDDPADEHEEVEEDDEAQDREDGVHGVKCDRRVWAIRRPGPQLWLNTPRPAAIGPSSALTSTVSGERRKTLDVTRSMDPRRPKTRPAAKSTRRLASASLMSVRFMITGTPSRKFSPMVLASL